MAWALYLSNTSAAFVTDAQLAELDDYELVSRIGPAARAEHLSRRIGHIVYALICAAGAINSRSQMLRSISLLHSLLTSADANLLRTAVRGLVQAYKSDSRISTYSQSDHDLDPPFLRPLVSIAVNRISDVELSAMAAHSLAILLGCSSFDSSVDNAVAPDICAQADVQTRRLIALLITEVVLTSSPRALVALSQLLRRDAARLAFCEKDGLSTLASTLQTHPGKSHTAIGEVVATATEYTDANPVYASYHAVFSVWMLTFATRSDITEAILQNVISSRLVVVLARLLNHASGQRLKIARLTLASLRNMVVGSTSLHHRIRRDLLAAEVPAVIRRLMRMASVQGSLMGNDDDAVADAQTLLDVLDEERMTMSTLDEYVAEVRAGALHASPAHEDDNFWVNHTEAIIDQFRDVTAILADYVKNPKTPPEIRVLACSDLANLLRQSTKARRVILNLSDLKNCLMDLMVHSEDLELKSSALLCVQNMLLHRTLHQRGS